MLFSSIILGNAEYLYFLVDGTSRKAVESTTLRITVKFPRGGFTSQASEFTDDLLQKPWCKNISAAKKSLLRIDLTESANVSVEGFRKPFSNPGHPSEGWLNRDEPLVSGQVNGESITLPSILAMRSFVFVVSGLDHEYLQTWWSASIETAEKPFSYPYGWNHSWNIRRYERMLPETRGPKFEASLTFDNDNDHMAAVTQAVAQDVMWIADAAAEIFTTKFSAYFVPTRSDGTIESRHYAIVPLTVDFRARYIKEWKRLTKDDVLQLAFHKDGSELARPDLEEEEEWHEKALDVWDAKIIRSTYGIDALNGHPTAEDDLVLLVCRGSKSTRKVEEVALFGNRSLANASFKEEKSH